jgi:signal transduction histidine kinase
VIDRIQLFITKPLKMKNLTISENTASLQNTTTISLNRLVNQLMTGLIPLAVNKKSFIINDVDQSMELEADIDVLAYVVGNLITNAVNSTQNSCIRVEAIVEGASVQIRVRNNSTHFYSSTSGGFTHLVSAARQIGGDISIHNWKNEGTTLVFSIAA